MSLPVSARMEARLGWTRGGGLSDGMHWAAMSGGGGVQLVGGRWVGTWVNGVEYLPTAPWQERPQGDVELTDDRILRLGISASGGGLSYQWRRDGIDLEDAPGRTGTRTPVLVLSPATEKDLGRYTVRVSNSVGTIEAEVWILDVAPPTIWGHRQFGSEAFVEGARVVFDVDVSGGLLDFQWRRNGIDLTDGEGVSGTRSETLVIDSCRPEHFGEYSVVVRNPRGSAQRVAGRVAPSAPQVLGFRQVGGPGVHLGDPVRLELWAGGGGVTIQWMKDGIPLGDAVSASGGVTNSVVLNAVQTSDLGRYWAVLSNHLGVTETPVFPVYRAIWEQVRAAGGVAGGRSISVSGDGRRLLIASPSSLLHSVNGGGNWTVGGTGGESGPGLRGLLLDAPGHWLLAKLGEPPVILRTEDGGVRWQTLKDPEAPDYWSLNGLGASSDGQALLASMDWGLWVSANILRYSLNGGSHWASVPSFPARGWYQYPGGVAVSRDGRVLAGLQNELDGDWRPVAYLSFDRGTNWVREVVSDGGWGSALSMTSEGGQLVCLAGGRLYARTGVDGRWRALPISGLAPVAPCVSDGGRRIHAVRAVPGSELGEIVQSSDGGQTWRWSGSLAARWVGLGCSADGSVVYGLSDRGLFRSPDPSSGIPAPVSARGVRAASGVSVVGKGEPFRTYSLVYSSRLDEGIWKPDGAVVSDGQGTFRLDAPASEETGFWLIRE